MYIIDYYYKSYQINATRKGSLNVTVDITHNKVQVSDNYDYAGNEDYSTVLEFTASLVSASGDNISSTQPAAAIMIKYSNRITSLTNLLSLEITNTLLANDTFTYSYRAIM